MSSPDESKPETYLILVVEDDDQDWALIERALSKARTVSFTATRVAHLNSALTALRHRRYDAILLDLLLQYDGPTNGLDTVVAVLKECADTPIVVLSHLGDIETAVRAVEFGAASFLEKPPDAHRLESVLRQVIERYVRDEVQRRLTYESVSQLLETEDAPALGLMVGGNLDAIESGLHHIRNYLSNVAPNHAAEVEKILGWGNVFASIATIRNILRITSPTERDTLPPPPPVILVSDDPNEPPGEGTIPTPPPVARARARRAISERALRKIQEIGEGKTQVFTADDARAFLLSVQTEDR